jgi:hypothetical protein
MNSNIIMNESAEKRDSSFQICFPLFTIQNHVWFHLRFQFVELIILISNKYISSSKICSCDI